MIIACPACATRYVVPDSAIGVDGRTVRCAKCRHSWFQDGPELAVPLEPTPFAPADAAPAAPPQTAAPVAEPAEPVAPFAEPEPEPTIISRMVREGSENPPMVIMDSIRDSASRGELACSVPIEPS